MHKKSKNASPIAIFGILSIVEKILLCSTFSFYDWMIENRDAFGDGPGLWCPLHITLMVLLAAWLIFAWFLFSKHKQFAMRLTTILAYLMIFFRIFRMALLYFSGTQTFVQVLPWHLCHVMSFVFPIFFLTKTKKGFLPVLTVTFFGGILTFIFGDYYYLDTLSFLHYESLFLHFCMPTVVVACLSSGYFKVRVKDFWQAFVGVACLAGWSMIGNTLIDGANYLYLMSNGLPFDLFSFMNWRYSYLLDYAILIFIITLVSILPFYFLEKRAAKKESFNIIMRTITDKNFD